MADLTISAKEYARFKQAERTYLIQKTEDSVRLIYSRDAAIEARNTYREALDTKLVSDDAYAFRCYMRELFSINTLFLLLGSCVMLPPIIVWDIQMHVNVRIAVWFLLLITLRSLFICMRLIRSGELERYAKFRDYMLNNRHVVQHDWEMQCSQIKELNAKIADEEQCNIPSDYQHVAGTLLYYIKSGGAESIGEATRRYDDDQRYEATQRQLDAIRRESEEIRDEVYRTQRNVDILEGLLALDYFSRNR